MQIAGEEITAKVINAKPVLPRGEGKRIGQVVLIGITCRCQKCAKMARRRMMANTMPEATAALFAVKRRSAK